MAFPESGCRPLDGVVLQSVSTSPSGIRVQYGARLGNAGCVFLGDWATNRTCDPLLALVSAYGKTAAHLAGSVPLVVRRI